MMVYSLGKSNGNKIIIIDCLKVLWMFIGKYFYILTLKI